MDHAFWIEKWKVRDIGFNQSKPHPFLLEYFDRFLPPKTGRVFVPLCGKTVDIGWLLSRGHRVVGSELVETAVQELFSNLGVKPQVEKRNGVALYQADGIDIFAGDLFRLTRSQLGPVDLVYDRAALVALPPEMRRRYAEHLLALTDGAPQLLICFEYDQAAMEGPPFCVPAEEVRRLYDKSYRPELLSSRPIEGGIKGKVAAIESVWELGKPH